MSQRSEFTCKIRDALLSELSSSDPPTATIRATLYMVANSIANSVIPPHPCSSLISHATKSTTHAHPIAYHSFINSPYFPIASTEATKTNKRVKKSLSDDFPALINPVEGEIIDASELHSQLLDWFETKKEAREMPWRKAIPVPWRDCFESELSKEEKKDLRERRNQRAYEVRLFFGRWCFDLEW